MTPDPGTPAASLAASVDRAFAPGGAIASAIDGFEPRESQREMAAAVAATLAEGGVLQQCLHSNRVPAIDEGHRQELAGFL